MNTNYIHLQRKLIDLGEKVLALRTTILEDRDRPKGDFALDDVYADEEILHQVKELTDLAMRLEEEETQRNPVPWLAHCNDWFLKLSSDLRSKWLSTTRVTSLFTYAKQNGKPGLRWWKPTQAGLDELSNCLDTVSAALLPCWFDLAVNPLGRSIPAGEVSITERPFLDATLEESYEELETTTHESSAEETWIEDISIASSEEPLVTETPSTSPPEESFEETRTGSARATKEPLRANLDSINNSLKSLSDNFGNLLKKTSSLRRPTENSYFREAASLDDLARSTLDEILGGRVPENDPEALQRVLVERFVLDEDHGHRLYHWNPNVSSVSAISGVASLSGRQTWLTQMAIGHFETARNYLDGLQPLDPDDPNIEQDDIDSTKTRITDLLDNLDGEFKNPDLNPVYVTRLNESLKTEVMILLRDLGYNRYDKRRKNTNDEKRVTDGLIVQSSIDSLSNLFDAYNSGSLDGLELGGNFYKLGRLLDLVTEQVSEVRHVLGVDGFGVNEQKTKSYQFNKSEMTIHTLLEMVQKVVNTGRTAVRQGKQDGIRTLKRFVRDTERFVRSRPKGKDPFSDDQVEEAFQALEEALTELDEKIDDLLS